MVKAKNPSPKPNKKPEPRDPYDMGSGTVIDWKKMYNNDAGTWGDGVTASDSGTPSWDKIYKQYTDGQAENAAKGIFDGPSSSDLYQQALDQVNGQYAAQLKALASAQAQAKNNAAKGQKDLKGMYSALVGDIGQNTNVLKGIYNSGAKDVNAAYSSGMKNVDTIYSKSQEGLTAMLEKLGIQASAPGVLTQGAENQAFSKSMLSNTLQGTKSAMALQRTGGLDFNVAQQNISNQTGVNARADLITNLNNTLANLASQKVGIQGQQSTAVANRQYQLEQDATNRQIQMQDMAYQAQKDALAKTGSSQLSPSQEWNQMSPLERTYSKASTVVGNDMAKPAVDIINRVMSTQQFHNVAEFENAVKAASANYAKEGKYPRIPDQQLAVLANFYWSQTNPKTINYPTQY